MVPFGEIRKEIAHLLRSKYLSYCLSIINTVKSSIFFYIKVYQKKYFIDNFVVYLSDKSRMYVAYVISEREKPQRFPPSSAIVSTDFVHFYTIQEIFSFYYYFWCSWFFFLFFPNNFRIIAHVRLSRFNFLVSCQTPTKDHSRFSSNSNSHHNVDPKVI